MASMYLTITNHALGDCDVKVVSFAGAADSSNVAEVDVAVSKILDENTCTHLLLEGGELTYVNSTFIGHLTEWFSRLEEKGGKLLLVNFRPNVIDTLTVVGLTNLMQHFPSVEEAELSLTLRHSPSHQPVAQSCVIP